MCSMAIAQQGPVQWPMDIAKTKLSMKKTGKEKKEQKLSVEEEEEKKGKVGSRIRQSELKT